ncbi:molybdopterin-dependent oxidoreductase [bacterium]|nr:molybdopterin-dependent oxidoreductase [bacterium]
MTEFRKTICPLDCPDSCGIVATVENGRIMHLQGDTEHPFTRGFLCRKMRHYTDRIYSDNRILYPQVRTGSKGSGEFKRVSWETAWDILVARLREIQTEHGSEALLPYSYAGNMGHINRWAGEAFFHRFGASRLKRTICSAAAGAAWQAHCGEKAGSDPETAADASLIIAWGINIKTTNVHFWPIVQQSHKRGGQLVVIDPYRNKTAKAADLYLPIQPGGDVALALGALKLILECRAENRAYIESQTSGFAEFSDNVADITWTDIETASGLSKDQITAFAELLKKNPRTFIRIGIGMTRNTGGAMSVRAILSLAAVLGLFDGTAGRGVLLSSRAFYGNSESLIHTRLAEKQTREVNMVQLGHALTLLKPAIHGLFVFTSNPLSVAPDSSIVRKGLAREDLFTVVHEQVMTPTARFADLLLPATTSFENSDVYTAYGHFQMGITQPVIPPIGEAISNFDLFQTLAKKMGYTDPPFLQSVDTRIHSFLRDLSGIDDAVDTSAIAAGTWISSIHRHAAHPKNRTRFYFVSRKTAPGTPAFACLMPLLEFSDPDLRSRYPLKLITPPAPHLLNSTFGESYAEETGQLLIHPQDASERKIVTGDRIRISNHRGESVREARVSIDTQPGLVVAEGIYWGNRASEYTGINDLTSQKTTDLGQGSTFHESLVEVAGMSQR